MFNMKMFYCLTLFTLLQNVTCLSLTRALLAIQRVAANERLSSTDRATLALLACSVQNICATSDEERVTYKSAGFIVFGYYRPPPSYSLEKILPAR